MPTGAGRRIQAVSGCELLPRTCKMCPRARSRSCPAPNQQTDSQAGRQRAAGRAGAPHGLQRGLGWGDGRCAEALPVRGAAGGRGAASVGSRSRSRSRSRSAARARDPMMIWTERARVCHKWPTPSRQRMQPLLQRMTGISEGSFRRISSCWSLHGVAETTLQRGQYSYTTYNLLICAEGTST